MTGFFPKIRCLLFGCTFWSKWSWVGPQWDHYQRHQLNQCRRCGNLPHAQHKIFITCMDELEKKLEENEELKEKLAKYENAE